MSKGEDYEKITVSGKKLRLEKDELRSTFPSGLRESLQRTL